MEDGSLAKDLLHNLRPSGTLSNRCFFIVLLFGCVSDLFIDKFQSECMLRRNKSMYEKDQKQRGQRKGFFQL